MTRMVERVGNDVRGNAHWYRECDDSRGNANPIFASGPFAAAGNLALGARYPTNTSGGHLSESYMQGWALNAEAVRQVRGACGDRQVKDCAFAHYMAAAPVCTSIIYGREPS